MSVTNSIFWNRICKWLLTRHTNFFWHTCVSTQSCTLSTNSHKKIATTWRFKLWHIRLKRGLLNFLWFFPNLLRCGLTTCNEEILSDWLTTYNEEMLSDWTSVMTLWIWCLLLKYFMVRFLRVFDYINNVFEAILSF